MSRNKAGRPNTMVQEVVEEKENIMTQDQGITNEPFEHTAPVISVGVDVPQAQEYTVIEPAPLSALAQAQQIKADADANYNRLMKEARDEKKAADDRIKQLKAEAAAAKAEAAKLAAAAADEHKAHNDAVQAKMTDVAAKMVPLQEALDALKQEHAALKATLKGSVKASGSTTRTPRASGENVSYDAAKQARLLVVEQLFATGQTVEKGASTDAIASVLKALGTTEAVALAGKPSQLKWYFGPEYRAYAKRLAA